MPRQRLPGPILLALILAALAVAFLHQGCRAAPPQAHPQPVLVEPWALITPDEAPEFASRAERFVAAEAAVALPKLFVVRLPAGDVPGFSIDCPWGSGHSRKFYSSRTAPALMKLPAAEAEARRREAAPGSFWLDSDQGYEGVRFTGAGIDQTHIRPGGLDSTVLVDQHNGIVAMDGLTVHAGKAQGIFFGLNHYRQPNLPRFKLALKYVHVLADPPPSGSLRSTRWGLFGYEADAWLEDVTLDLKYAAEHASYWHGFASEGITWNRVRVVAAGAQGFKVRNDTSEVDFVQDASVTLTACTFTEWHWPWTDRGGAAFVSEGGGIRRITITGTTFVGGGPVPSPGAPWPMLTASARAKAVMIDDAAGNFYSADDLLDAEGNVVAAAGTVGRGYATGDILIQNCGFIGGPGETWLSHVIRINGNSAASSDRFVAKSVRIFGCGIFGRDLMLELGRIPPGKTAVVGCNSAAIRTYAQTFGWNTSHEAVIPLAHRVALVSEGVVR